MNTSRASMAATDPRLQAGCARIRLFVTDVDGTLTDGGMYYTAEGEVMKRFDTRDAAGMARLRKRGVTLAIMTLENSPIVLARARKLKIEHVYVGIEDKAQKLSEVMGALGLDWPQVAYIGDDLNDLSVIERVGVSACPSDAAPQVARAVQYVCHKPGGHGAVREFTDAIFDAMSRTEASGSPGA